MTDQERLDILARVQAIRAKNNVPWMKFVEIALRVAPEEAQAVVREIFDNDRAVSAEWIRLAE